jgi:hydrogenase maturation protease
MTARTMIAGIGNIFLGDDGFGVEVARRLAGADLPEGVRVADYGISGMHLAYDLAEGYDTTILIDASPRGGEPGTVSVVEVSTDRSHGSGLPDGQVLDAHGMQPDVVLGVLGMLGADPGRVLVVGCEPASSAEGIGLSAPVAAAVDQAARIVLDLVRDAGPDRQTAAGKSAKGDPCASASRVR